MPRKNDLSEVEHLYEGYKPYIGTIFSEQAIVPEEKGDFGEIRFDSEYNPELDEKEFTGKKQVLSKSGFQEETRISRPRKPDLGPMLTDLFSDRLGFLQQVIEEINEEKKERKRLQNGFQKDIDEEINYCLLLLKEITPPIITKDPVILQRKSNLERLLNSLKREDRDHKARTWHELLWIEKELREILPEYKTLKKLKEVLD